VSSSICAGQRGDDEGIANPTVRTGMAKSANPRRLTLAEAAAFIADRRQIESDESRRILLALLQNDEITGRGAVPLSALPDVNRAWQHPVAPSVQDIPSGAWFLEVDWTLGHLGRYRHITIAETDLTALFRAARGPGVRPSSTTVKKVVADYVASAHKDQKPTSQVGCLAYKKTHLPGATRAQVLAEYRSVEPPKPPGRPRKGNPPD
jgi:hypothetical protein